MRNMESISVVDWGSSKAVGKNGILFSYSLEKDVNLTAPMAYLDSSSFELKMNQVVESAKSADVIGLTGFSHSLVPILKNGVVRAAMIGDDPSLTPKRGIPDRLQSYYPDEKTKITSAVRKLAGLQEHPELMEVLFGGTYTGEVRYSSVLSLAAWRLLGQPDRFDIFPDEALDFVNGEMTKPTSEELTNRFGLNRGQIELANNEVQRVGGKEVWLMQDIRADIKVLKQLFDLQILPQDTWVMATDSVLKRIRTESDQATTYIEGLYYDTMRMMGNTGTKYVKPLLLSKGLANNVWQTFEFMEKVLIDSKLPTDWCYDPTADNQCGRLWKREGSNYISMNFDDLNTLENDEVVEVVKACGWGMAAAMYERIPPEVKHISLYGGLIGFLGQLRLGWKQVFCEAAPENCEVSWLKIPDSRVALEMVIRAEKGEQIDYAKETPIIEIGQGGGQHKRWQEMKNETSLHDRMKKEN